MNTFKRSLEKSDAIDQFVTKRVFPRVNNKTALEFQVCISMFIWYLNVFNSLRRIQTYFCEKIKLSYEALSLLTRVIVRKMDTQQNCFR